MKRLDLRVHGIVQGVFFRELTRRKANELGVSGTVRNEPEGTVFIEAEAPARALDALVEWCRSGPPAAHVERVDQMPGEPEGFQGFVIR